MPIPERAFVVSETAFRGCAALRSLDLANVTSIGTKAFTGCSTLASISLKPSSDILPTVENEDAFDEWHFANTLIEVPDDKYSSFTTDAFWSKFSSYKHPALLAYTEVTGGYSVGKSPYALNEDFIGMQPRVVAAKIFGFQLLNRFNDDRGNQVDVMMDTAQHL